jgi:putative cell wall-binding protein
MRRKLPVLILALIILLQAFTPAVFAASKNEVQSQTAYLCPFDPTSEGAGKGGMDLQLFAEGAGKGFDNFNALKKNLGPAGEGKAWHHVVEQSQIQKSGFNPQQIHNTNNVIAVDSATHAKISGYYNSIRPDISGNMRVRDWLAGQSYEYQYEFGIDILKQFGVIK